MITCTKSTEGLPESDPQVILRGNEADPWMHWSLKYLVGHSTEHEGANSDTNHLVTTTIVRHGMWRRLLGSAKPTDHRM